MRKSDAMFRLKCCRNYLNKNEYINRSSALSGDSIVLDVLMRIFAKMKSDG